jgi:putative alpha-1,2-mannosidase
MAKAVADVNGESQGGFASDNRPVIGFSHMHDSGTGGVNLPFPDYPPKYSPLKAISLGNFPIFPQSGCPNDDINACNYTSWDRQTPVVNGSVEARPGFFALTLESQIHAEMTVTNHTALYRFTFPSVPPTANTTLAPHILLELNDLPQTRQDARIQINPETGRMRGWGRFQPSFGIGNYSSYFCADFAGAKLKDSGIFTNSRAASGLEEYSAPSEKTSQGSERPAGGWVQFEKPDAANQIVVRVGLSFISEAQACSNAEKEIPSPKLSSVETVVSAAERIWREKLDVVKVVPGGVSKVILTAFWSGLYRSMISPQDYTGENPLWKSDEPYYDSYYCIWDSFRSIHPLLTLVDPHSQTLMVRALLDIYRHEGKLPDCRMSFCKGMRNTLFTTI